MDASYHNGEVAEISEKLEKSLSMGADDRMETYHRFIQDGKDVARNGDMHKALELFKQAYNIHQSQKLESRINKIEELLAQNESEEEDDDFVNVNNSGLMLFKELHDKLYDYQRNGVAFLYSLYRDGRKGGILADDMGLGKTIQVISFLSGMYDNELVKHTLLVMPTSLITNWTREFAKWTPGMRVKEFHGVSKGERTRNLEKVQRRGGVIITTYTMLINNWQQLASHYDKEFTWDYMILDEAHKIKSTTTKTAKSAYAIPSKNRVLLTGTPVQNNLREMWALFDFACQGTLLGTSKTFKTEYENPITRAREKDATPGEKALGSRMSENLMAIIQPYFLRRTKAEVQKSKINAASLLKDEHPENRESVQSNGKDSGAAMPTLTRKNDLIVWTYLSGVQEDIYRQFISLDHIKELLMTTRSPLAELNILKKLCDHPRLLSAGAIAKLGLEESTVESQQSDDVDAGSHSISNVSDDTLISESGKLVFLFALLERLRQEGHRTLVFAHYRKVLDIIERILGNRGFKVLRLDGTITQIAERERLISLFQKDERYSVFLLTTQVGGVGITLTAADRVVIYDPSWNPATDAQAVDRAYRIGQTENVVIYRLITCGTVEEKIYRRQVFKDSLIRQNTGDKKNPFRYFSKQELKELFTLEDTRSSSTQLQLQSLHSRHRRTDPELDMHIAHLHTMEMFGISDHDLMFSLDVNHDEAPENQEENQYIEGRVQKAQELMKAESELQMQLAESIASSTEPTWLKKTSENRNIEQSHENKTRNPSPKNDSNFNSSPVIVDLDQSGSGKEDAQHSQSHHVIDLTAESEIEDQPVVELSQDSPNQESLKPQLLKQERSYLKGAKTSAQDMEESLMETAEVSEEESLGQSVKSEAADAPESSSRELLNQSEMFKPANNTGEELLGKSVTSEAADVAADDVSLSYSSAVDVNEQHLNGTSRSVYEDSKMDLSSPQMTPLKNKQLSILQASRSSFKADASWRGHTGAESFEGNFNLQLEDSDLPPDHEEEPQESEAVERKLLSQLQMEGSFDVNKSLFEMQHKEALEQNLHSAEASEVDASANDSIVITRRKRAAVIYDSEDDEDERQQLMRSQLENSFQALGASTPKTAPSGSTPRRSRKSIGGNTSVASRRSLLQSLIEGMENHNQYISEEDAGSHDGDLSERHSDEAEEEDEEDLIGHDDDLQPEETTGETINTEAEEEEYDEEDMESGEEMSTNLELSTGEQELKSTEMMEQCTVGSGVATDGIVESESYDSLVCRGRECYSQGKLDDALDLFLRAIDIQPGDPEIQLMTIQLYRQLSQRR